MKNKFKEFACEFKNRADCIEEIDPLGIDFSFEEMRHFGVGQYSPKEKEEKPDEEKYMELIESGMSKQEAAHLINKLTERKLKESFLTRV